MSSSTADAAPTAPDGGPDPFADLAPDASTPPANADGVDDDGDDDLEDTDGADDLGDKGKQALERMKAKLKETRTKLRATEAQLAQKPADGKPADDAIETARREGEAAATAKANAKILRSEIKVAAAGKLADPADALRLLDLDQFDISEDGEVDADELSDAIDDLLRTKPYLAAQGGTKAPKPDRSQGARGSGAASTAQQFADAIPL